MRAVEEGSLRPSVLGGGGRIHEPPEYLAQGEAVDKSSTHRENPASSSWIHGAGYAGQ